VQRVNSLRLLFSRQTTNGSSHWRRPKLHQSMKLTLSTSAGYAIHALHFIASSKSEDPVMAREVADAYQIPYDSALKILRQLSRAGLAKAHRGCQGGFSLRRNADDISLLEIVTAIDGKIDLTDPFPQKTGNRRLKRATNKILNEAMLDLRDRLRRTSLGDL